MNGITESQTATQTVFNGPLSLSTTVLVALALLILFAGSLYRERRVLGKWTTLGFASLRLVVLVTMLWMLLAPTRVMVETSTTPRRIAILTDTSASMMTIDPPGTADEIRWSANVGNPDLQSITNPTDGAATGGAHGGATALADNALVCLTIAIGELTTGIDAVRQHHPNQKIAKSFAATQNAIDRCQANLDQLQQWPLSETVGNERTQAIRPAMQSAQRLLKSPEFQDFRSLTKRLTAGQTPQQPDWRESLRDLQYRVQGTRQVLVELSRRVADAETPTRKESSHPSRLHQVASFLETLQMQTLDSLGETVQVRWSQFDKTVTSLPIAQSPTTSLLKRSEPSSLDRDPASGTESGTLATNLSAALQSLKRNEGEIPIAAAFLFTDVAHNDTGLTIRVGDETQETDTEEIPLPTQVASTLGGTPVYIVPIGNTNRLRDVRFTGIDAPTVAMRNDDIVIEAHVEAYQCQGDRCTIELLDGSEVVDFRQLQFDSNFSSRSVRFQRRVSEIGEASFRVVIRGVDGEMTQDNNHRKIGIHVTRNQIRVLLADEMPRWEFRYLAQLFRRDPKIECDEMLFHPRLIATGSRQSRGTFPITADEWDEYDVVILGDLTPEHLPVVSQESLAEYLRHRGGTVVLIAGSRAMPDAFAKTPLGKLLPITKADVPLVAPNSLAFHATREGRSHVAMMIGETQQATQTAWDFVNRFSPLHEVSPWRLPKPSAKNLIAVVPRGQSLDETAEVQDSFMCWQPIGRGRVVYFSGPDTYRLRFLRGDRCHYRFWGQLLRWAIASNLGSGTKRVRLRTNKKDYASGQDVDIELRLSSEAGTPITDPGDLLLNVTSGDVTEQLTPVADNEVPGLYHAHLNSPPSGVYAIEPAGGYIDTLPTSDPAPELGLSFSVQADLPMELSDTRCNRVLASQICALTGGQVLPPCAVAEVLSLTDLSPIVAETTYQTPLWSQWKYLWLVFGCLQTEWIIRKWRGLS